MTVAIQIAAALLALGATALIIWACEHFPAPEDPGRLSPGYMRKRGWGRRW